MSSHMPNQSVCLILQDTEFVLVELTAQKASYKDFNDVFQMGNFDFGLLINQNTIDIPAESNTLVLNFYIILTSQRDLYPKLSSFGLGSFQTVRYGSSQASSSYSSRKTSMVSVITEKEKFESSGDSTTSSSEGRFVMLHPSILDRHNNLFFFHLTKNLGLTIFILIMYFYFLFLVFGEYTLLLCIKC